MKELLEILNTKPKLFEQDENNIWTDPHIAKGMLKAHLDETLDSATRNIDFIEKSIVWIATQLPPHKYPKLLDLGCGPGIYTEKFYQEGYHVTGLDFSKLSIEHAKKSANRNKMAIDYILGDYNIIDFPSKYDVITLIYCDFGVLPMETRKGLLNKIFDSLNDQGVLLFDVFTPLKYTGIEESRSFEISKDGFWHQDICLSLNSFYRYDEDNTFLNQYTILTNDNKITNYNVWEHTFTLKELEDDLKHAGFRTIKFFGDLSGKRYEESSQTICVLALKE